MNIKKLLLALLITCSVNTYCASTTVQPFQFEFYTPKSSINVKATLYQSCQYEESILGSSWGNAQYKTEYKKPVELLVEKTSYNDLEKISISLKDKQQMTMTGYLKPSKQCRSDIKVVLSDAKYTTGWAGLYDKEISFSFAEDSGFKREDFLVYPNKLIEKLEDKVFSLHYEAHSNQVNIFLYRDGLKMGGFYSETALLNKETGTPFLLRK